MAFQPVEDGVQINIYQQLFDQDIVNVLFFRGPSEVSTTQLGQLSNQVAAVWKSLILPHLSTDITLQAIEAKDVSIENGPVVVTPVVPLAGGTVASPSAPGNVAFCLTHRTAKSGKSYRGRSYIAGIVKADLDGNKYSADRVTGLTYGFNEIRIDAANLGFNFSVVSRFANKAARPIAILTQVTSTTYTDLIVDSQRRRLTKRGR